MLDYRHPVLSFLGVIYICNAAVVLTAIACHKFKCELIIDTMKKEKKTKE